MIKDNFNKKIILKKHLLSVSLKDNNSLMEKKIV